MNSGNDFEAMYLCHIVLAIGFNVLTAHSDENSQELCWQILSSHHPFQSQEEE